MLFLHFVFICFVLYRCNSDSILCQRFRLTRELLLQFVLYSDARVEKFEFIQPRKGLANLTKSNTKQIFIRI